MSILPTKTLPYGVRKRKVGHWNVYSMDGVLETITASGVPYLSSDSITTGAIEASPSNIKPFYCPNCGGNSYRKINGKIVCDYCDTEFLTSTIPSENPLKDLHPKPIPIITNYEVN